MSKETASPRTAMRTKQSKERLISIHFTDRLSPKGPSIAGFCALDVGLETASVCCLGASKMVQVSSGGF
ncbi:hypothetical protein MCEREM21A_01682 [Sphingomonadaceae bacterium]